MFFPEIRKSNHARRVPRAPARTLIGCVEQLEPRSLLAAIAGTLDTSFGGDGIVTTDFNEWGAEVQAVAIQSDGKILAGGNRKSDGRAQFALTRYAADGSLDESFGTGGSVVTVLTYPQRSDPISAGVSSVVVQPDGKIVAVGLMKNVQGYWMAFMIARYNANGTLDTSFGSNGVVWSQVDGAKSRQSVRDIVVQPDGKVLVAGTADVNAWYDDDYFVRRYNADGSVDASFGSNGQKVIEVSGYVQGAVMSGVVVLPGGKLLVAGGWTYEYQNQFKTTQYLEGAVLVRLNGDGSYDETFWGSGMVYRLDSTAPSGTGGVVVMPDGRIVVGGYWYLPDRSGTALGAWRFNADGTYDTTFNGQGFATVDCVPGFEMVRDVAVQPDGKVVVLGVDAGNGQGNPVLVRFTANGSRDYAFGNNGVVIATALNSQISSLALQSDGRMVVGGRQGVSGANRTVFALYRFLGDPLPASPPTNVIATPGNGQVTLAWAPPSSDGGATITDYVIRYSTDGGKTWTKFERAASPDPKAELKGLQNGTSYMFRVRAVNAAGPGAVSSTVTVTPAAPPSAPTITSATPSNTQVTLAWTPPASNGGSAITDYAIRYSSDNGVTWTRFERATSTDPTAVVNGLQNGLSYMFRVRAVNAAGPGTPSNTLSATPALPPGAPTITSTTGGNGQVTVAWSAPGSTGGSPITGYAVEFKTVVAATWSQFPDTGPAARSAIVTGLQNGTAYVFRVSAKNAVGTGVASGASASVTPRAVAPGIPTITLATAGNRQVSLAWSAPASDGGSTLTDYVVEFKRATATSWSVFADGISTTPSAVVKNLINGVAYVFRVSAKNAVGTGTASAQSASVTPKA